MQRRRFLQRPEGFRLDPTAGLARGLVFAGLGGGRGSVTMRDSSLKNNHGTLTNMDPATDWIWSGELGRWVLDFDGSNDYVALPNDISFSSTGCVCGWVYQTDKEQVNPFAYQQKPGNEYDRIVMNISGPRSAFSARRYRLFMQIRGNGTASTSTWGTTALDEARWYHVAFQQTGVRGEMWLDGVLDGTVATTDWWHYHPTGMTWGFGTYAYTGDVLNGRIASPLVFTRALSPAEIQALADPSNVMLSGLILPPRRRLWAVGGAPLSLTGDALNLESPYAVDDPVDTAAAAGGSTPYSYAITAQAADVGVLKVTGTLDPDATGVYVENGTYNGEPAYERTDGAYWIWYDPEELPPLGGVFISSELGVKGEDGWWQRIGSNPVVQYSAVLPATGDATVANATPFQINASTGAITIADPDPLIVGHVWTVNVEVTDDASATASDDWVVTLTPGAVVLSGASTGANAAGTGALSVTTALSGAGSSANAAGTGAMSVAAALSGASEGNNAISVGALSTSFPIRTLAGKGVGQPATGQGALSTMLSLSGGAAGQSATSQGEISNNILLKGFGAGQSATGQGALSTALLVGGGGVGQSATSQGALSTALLVGGGGVGQVATSQGEISNNILLNGLGAGQNGVSDGAIHTGVVVGGAGSSENGVGVGALGVGVMVSGVGVSNNGVGVGALSSEFPVRSLSGTGSSDNGIGVGAINTRATLSGASISDNGVGVGGITTGIKVSGAGNSNNGEGVGVLRTSTPLSGKGIANNGTGTGALRTSTTLSGKGTAHNGTSSGYASVQSHLSGSANANNAHTSGQASVRVRAFGSGTANNGVSSSVAKTVVGLSGHGTSQNAVSIGQLNVFTAARVISGGGVANNGESDGALLARIRLDGAGVGGLARTVGAARVGLVLTGQAAGGNAKGFGTLENRLVVSGVGGGGNGVGVGTLHRTYATRIFNSPIFNSKVFV